MPKRDPIVLAGVSHLTKKAALESVRAMVAAATLKMPLTGAAHLMCLDLVERHPDRDEKAGIGIMHFRVVEMPGFGGRHLQIVRVDGSTDLFSWNVAIDGCTRPPTRESVARRAIADQVVEFKNRHYWLEEFAPCHCCGRLARFRDTIVHHAHPHFRILLDDWLATRERAPPIAGSGSEARFADPADAASWRAFHARWAVLQLIAVTCHNEIHHPKAAAE